MTLTPRQRAKINAALCLLHDHGHDANAVIGMANRLMKDGQDPRSAYEASLNTYLSVEPAMLPTVSKVLKLVDASDDRTVDQYDAALSAYVSTGDDSELVSLAPMIAQDSLDLALREGEITPEEAASGDLAKALGFEPREALQEAIAAKAEQASAPQQTQQERPPQQWKPLEQAAAPQIGTAPAATDMTNGSQIGLGGVTGYVAPGARAAWARETLQPGSEGYPSADAASA